jgi:RecA/RadA recombinase
MSSFFRDLVEQIKDEDTTIVADGEGSAEFTGCIDTGSYILNAVVSGSLYGGVPNNKITAFAGESATGKTFFVLGIVKAFLDANPDAGVLYYDTEAAVTKEMMSSRGIDVNRVIISEPDTIQKFRNHAIKMIDAYIERPKDKRPPMMFVLDSLGLLSTTKEMEDMTEGKETRDMTKAQVIKAAFRVLTLKLAKAGIPMLVTNHVYDLVGAYVPTKEIGGGSGLKYAASTIAMLGKKKDKDGTDVVGNIIRVKMHKSRLSKENGMVEVKLSYSKGLDRYYGLLDLAEKYNIIKKVSTRYELPDGTKVFGKNINEDPEKYFTAEILEQLEVAAKKEFSYGGAQVDDREDDTYPASDE